MQVKRIDSRRFGKSGRLVMVLEEDGTVSTGLLRRDGPLRLKPVLEGCEDAVLAESRGKLCILASDADGNLSQFSLGGEKMKSFNGEHRERTAFRLVKGERPFMITRLSDKYKKRYETRLFEGMHFRTDTPPKQVALNGAGIWILFEDGNLFVIPSSTDKRGNRRVSPAPMILSGCGVDSIAVYPAKTVIRYRDGFTLPDGTVTDKRLVWRHDYAYRTYLDEKPFRRELAEMCEKVMTCADYAAFTGHGKTLIFNGGKAAAALPYEISDMEIADGRGVAAGPDGGLKLISVQR